MRFRAWVKNEGRIDCPWFVYVRTEHGNGSSAVARFGSRRSAEKIANTMNAAWASEGRYYEEVTIDG